MNNVAGGSAMVPGWIDAIDAEVCGAISRPGPFTPGELARALRVSEACAFRYIVLLAEAGRLRIEAVTVPTAAGVGTPPRAPGRRAA
jgi:hypothetical protein